MAKEEPQAVATITGDVSDILSFEEAIQQSGLSQADVTVVIDPYTALGKDKDVLVDTPFFIRKVQFTEDKTTHKPFAIAHVVTNANQLFRLTDGSTGIYKQLTELCEKYGRGHSFLIANGLRKSEYGLTKDGVPVEIGAPDMDSKGATYYLA